MIGPNSLCEFDAVQVPLPSLIGTERAKLKDCTREVGVRLAVGSAPRQLLASVLPEGVLIAAIGIAVRAAAGMRSRAWRRHSSGTCNCQGRFPWSGGAAVLIVAAIVASLMPAARASRVDVLQALRSE
ncbi:MAG TPA: hypothetical protein VK886_00150 [Vicinamibacterales bacterium]|nr:hypothetical protein [Vicinamibacterales bacterium]